MKRFKEYLNETIKPHLKSGEDKDMIMMMAKEMAQHTGMRYQAVYDWLKKYNYSFMDANKMMSKHHKDKSWTKLMKIILNNKKYKKG